MTARLRVAVTLTAFSFLTVACATDRQAAQRYADRAARYAAGGHYAAAAIEYRNAIRYQPAWASAHRQLADVYAAQGRSEEAYREYCRAAELSPADVRSRIEAGRLLFAAGQFERALERADDALSHDPGDIDARILRGRTLVKVGRFDEAVEQLDTALNADRRRPATYAALGEATWAIGDREGAERAFRQGTAAAPQSVEARVALAQFLSATARPLESERELVDALAIQPANELANRALASLFLSTGRRERAESCLRTAAKESNQKLGSTLALADYYRAANRFDDAREVLERVTGGPLARGAQTRLAALERERPPHVPRGR